MGRIDHEAGPIGQRLKRGSVRNVRVDRSRQQRRGVHEGNEAGRDHERVDPTPREAPYRVCDCRNEVAGDTLSIELEVGPTEGKEAGGQRASRNGRDSVDLRQHAEFIEPPERPEME